MAGDTGSTALRELLFVVAVAAAGLLLATVAVFTPWHATPGGAAPVELHSPAGAVDVSDPAAGAGQVDPTAG